MQLSTPITVLLLTLSGAHANPVDTSPIGEADLLFAPFDSLDARTVEILPGTPGRLVRRQCDYNGCKCNSRKKQITGCGSCRWASNLEWLVREKRVLTHIFECAPSGNCCSYGFARDCNTSGQRCIIN